MNNVQNIVNEVNKQKYYLLIIVASLGYFVDIYDLILFGIVRQTSVAAFGLLGDAATKQGIFLLNVQMVGLVVGGFLWGILGDKRGRLTVLFGSIALYSLANIANGFVTDLGWYAALRFIAGVGLAGELGAGITLVTETMPTDKRGIGTTVIASFGLLGAVVAGLVGGHKWGLSWQGQAIADWRIAYFVGGGLGLILLVLRLRVAESGMYTAVSKAKVKTGAFLQLITQRRTLFRYLACILIGLPLWFIIGILVFFSAEISKEIGVVNGPVVVGTCIMVAYFGLSIGDLSCGLVSQWLRSRRFTIAIYMGLSIATALVYLYMRQVNLTQFYGMCFLLGLTSGYWAMFVTVAAEQFGTNIRATVTTTVPNLVRGSVVPVSFVYGLLHVRFGEVNTAVLLGAFCFTVAAFALASLKESFHYELDYVEEL